MNNKTIYISENDYGKLVHFIELYIPKSYIAKIQLAQFKQVLESAVITAPENIPSNIITLNSQFRIIDTTDQKDYIYTIVLPNQANIKEMKISILAPLGLALIGHAVGDVTEYKTEAGSFTYKIMELLYQPERVGLYS